MLTFLVSTASCNEKKYFKAHSLEFVGVCLYSKNNQSQPLAELHEPL